MQIFAGTISVDGRCSMNWGPMIKVVSAISVSVFAAAPCLYCLDLLHQLKSCASKSRIALPEHWFLF
jgi:hypothetical protein